MSETPKPIVNESAEYDNFLDVSKRQEDRYSTSLESFFDEPVKKIPYDPSISEKPSEGVYKVIYVHFRTVEDLAEFCSKVGQVIQPKIKEIFYPAHDPDASLFSDITPTKTVVSLDLLKPKRKKKSSASLDVEVTDEADVNAKWREHWKEMPEFEQEENPPFRTVHVKFRTKEHYEAFSECVDQELSDKTKSIWYPKLEITANRFLRWVEDEPRTDPKYPLYIVSKGRHESMHTSRSLARMQIFHYIIIEPQDYDNYDKALDEFDIRGYVKLVVAPFSNHGDGPGRARNYAWDHSIEIGATSHWVFDDNISDFYRLHNNQRVRFESGAGFKAMEDFVDRYENVYISGLQYRFFVAPDQKYPPYVTNTRIYSSLLIRNDCPHRWRGRYNEDTDICLRVLKDGHCTVQFNAFMQGKAATQTVKGGNTEEFYHVEGDLDKSKWRDGQLNAEGTINKSQMLVDMHPDVARMVWRYGRWHHHVDYSPFKKNKLKLKPEVNLKSEVNSYGMRFVEDFEA